MKDSVGIRKMAGFIFTSVAGTFLHFLFGLTGGNRAAGLISAVNESIWEHMKLIFVPMALFAIVESRLVREKTPGFWCVKLRGILLALILIPVLYYTYTGILGVSADWFNIAIFFLAAGAAYRYEGKAEAGSCALPVPVAVALIAVIGVLFGVLTFKPLRIPLFRDPVDGSYGYGGTVQGS